MPKTKRVPYAHGERVADHLLARIRPYVSRSLVTGSLRRLKPDIGDIDVVVLSELPAFEVLGHAGAEIYEYGQERASGIFEGLQINLWRAQPEGWGAMVLYSTGPSQYGIAYRMRAKRMGLLLNQHGLWRGSQRIAGRTEQEIYAALGKNWKPPELRGK